MSTCAVRAVHGKQSEKERAACLALFFRFEEGEVKRTDPKLQSDP